MKVKVIRSNRKTISIQVNTDLTVTVRAPVYATNKDIDKILHDKESWIMKHMEQIREQNVRYEIGRAHV